MFGCSKGGGDRRSGENLWFREGQAPAAAEANVKGFRKQRESFSARVTRSKWLAKKIIFTAVLDGLNGRQ